MMCMNDDWMKRSVTVGKILCTYNCFSFFNSLFLETKKHERLSICRRCRRWSCDLPCVYDYITLTFLYTLGLSNDAPPVTFNLLQYPRRGIVVGAVHENINEVCFPFPRQPPDHWHRKTKGIAIGVRVRQLVLHASTHGSYIK